jgi:hypothetical protein
MTQGDPFGGSGELEDFGFDRFDEIGGVWLEDQPAKGVTMMSGHGDGGDFDVNVIPEPASIGLWLVAIFTLLFRRGRRSQPVIAPIAVRA